MSAKRLMMFLGAMMALVVVGRMVWPSTAVAGKSPSNPAAYDIAAPHGITIPQAALRLRIIANSDSPQDQAVKLKVRNAVVVAAASDLKGVTSSSEARKVLERDVPRFQSIAEQVLRQNGFSYGARTEVGVVPFPTKVYGNQVYPAGNYEALRIVLGTGQGQNWWCVLYPPLCFIDITDGDAVPNTGGFPDLPPLETITVPNMNGGTTEVAVRLASVDYGEELWKSVRAAFQGGNKQ